MKKITFYGINELRALASLAVVLHHLELYKFRDGFPSLYTTVLGDFISTLGKNAVYLFFVLSGFLITYLLLLEKEAKGDIDLKSFYIRRALRIWPIYYFLLGVSFFLLPALVEWFPVFKGEFYLRLISQVGEGFGFKLLLFVLFLPNLALFMFPPVVGISQSWSVGVEEQFYLLWPIFLKYFYGRIHIILWVILLLKVSLQQIIQIFVDKNSSPYLQTFYNFNIELMALGGLGAYYLVTKKLNLDGPIFKRKWAYLVVFLVLLLMFFKVNYVVLSVFFLAVILFNIHDTTRFVQNKYLFFLGRISYGMYMYHPLIIFFVFSILYKYNVFEKYPYYTSFIADIIVFGATVLISHISYIYLEKPFLAKKESFSLIKSGD